MCVITLGPDITSLDQSLHRCPDPNQATSGLVCTQTTFLSRLMLGHLLRRCICCSAKFLCPQDIPMDIGKFTID